MRLAAPRLWLTLLPLALAAALLSWVWSDLMLSIVTWQQALHERLADHIKDVRNAPWTVGGSLMALSLFYGVFHAAGPGHGKAVLITYLATQKENIRQSVMIAIAAALLQALVAVGLISVVALMLGWTFRDTQTLGTQVQLGSYALVIFLGLYIVIHTLNQLWQSRRAHCHHTPQVTSRLRLKQAVALIFSMGLRPCSGALLVLIYAHLVGVYAFGVAATFVMAIGTALTVSVLAIVSVLLRDRLQATTDATHHHHHHTSMTPMWIRLAGGLILLALGIGLFMAGWGINQNHPLF